MILQLENINKHYLQDKLEVPVLKILRLKWKRENMSPSWDLQDQESQP